MRLLIVEFFPEKGHSRLFTNIARLLGEEHHVVATLPKKTGKQIENVDVRELPVGYFRDRRHFWGSKLDLLWYSIKILRFVSKLDKKENYDAIVGVTYNESAFALSTFFLRQRQKVILMNHNNLDFILENTYKKKLFLQYARKVRHIVQCKYIAEMMKDSFNIEDNKVGIWLHPLNSNTVSEKVEKDIDCVGISNSNDENIIREIVEEEKKSGFLKNAGKKVILRSKEITYEDGYLSVIKGELPKTKYDEYIDRARCLFLPFPETFCFRMSGTLVDAFSNKKVVIGTSIRLLSECQKSYPKLIKKYELNRFVEAINDAIEMFPDRERDFSYFSDLHSDLSVKNNMLIELNRICGQEGIGVSKIDF